jgi:DNA-binding NarL/FixJ family response regulator
MSTNVTTIRVALVEDDARFREAFSRAIEQAPSLRFVGAAANGTQGLDLLRATQPDVLLIDLDLPDIPGVELIRFAASNLVHCDVMVITVFGDEKHVIESLEAGATGYLLKDSLPADFVEQIHILRNGGSPISPTIARQLLTRFTPAPQPTQGEDEAHLSEREASVLNLVSKGYTHSEIAGLLQVSPHTVLTYVKRIYRKLQVTSKAEALHEARARGLMKN